MVDYNTIIEVDKDYYNLDDIMATKTNIGCTYGQETPPGWFFTQISNCFSYILILEIFKIIGQKPPEQILAKGYKTDTPIWMAEMLCTKNVFHVQVCLIFFHSLTVIHLFLATSTSIICRIKKEWFKS